MVDILSGVLSGSVYADKLCPRQPDGRRLSSGIGHFFLALDVRTFRPFEEFQADMDDLIRRLKESEKSEGETRIYIPGEKELETEEKRRREGIPLHYQVVHSLEKMASSVGLPSPIVSA